jgi:hypothetical protein
MISAGSKATDVPTNAGHPPIACNGRESSAKNSKELLFTPAPRVQLDSQQWWKKSGVPCAKFTSANLLLHVSPTW